MMIKDSSLGEASARWHAVARKGRETPTGRPGTAESGRHL